MLSAARADELQMLKARKEAIKRGVQPPAEWEWEQEQFVATYITKNRFWVLPLFLLAWLTTRANIKWFHVHVYHEVWYAIFILSLVLVPSGIFYAAYTVWNAMQSSKSKPKSAARKQKQGLDPGNNCQNINFHRFEGILLRGLKVMRTFKDGDRKVQHKVVLSMDVNRTGLNLNPRRKKQIEAEFVFSNIKSITHILGTNRIEIMLEKKAPASVVIQSCSMKGSAYLAAALSQLLICYKIREVQVSLSPIGPTTRHYYWLMLAKLYVGIFFVTLHLMLLTNSEWWAF